MTELAPEPRTAAPPVPALVRAKRVLDAICEDNRPRGSSELARELGLPRSTVHTLCRTLADLGLLVRVNSTEFSIGPHVLSWAKAFEDQSSMTQAFAELAEPLDWAEAINLSVLTGREVMYISCRQGSDPLGVRFREGLRFPAAFTATGKAILSTMSDEDVVAMYEEDWPEALTSTTVGSLDALLGELAEVRQRAYSVDNGQLREAMFCCGAPVFSAGGGATAVAGVAIAILQTDVSESSVRRIGEAASSFAAELSRRLGGTTRL
jgi:DNA-binding IclR family transcriptional regulator